MKNFIKISFISILCLAYFLPTVSFAAAMFFSSEKNAFAPRETFLVEVFANTDDANVNAVEGSVLFPAELLELKEIRDGNSSINFWVEKPHSTAAGSVYFSGITPGGFSGAKHFLFGMVFESKSPGQSALQFSGVKILKNDGLGTQIPTTAMPFSFTISETSTTPAEDLRVTDIDPPEDFTPFIASDPTIFNGKYFLVFSATDKGVGLDHFEVREGIWSDYVRAESPYLLKDQSLSKDILVKAVDKYGNKKVIKVKAQNPHFKVDMLVILGIILLVCFAIFKRIWVKKSLQ